LINARIPGNLEISRLSVSWLGPQIVEGVVLKDPQGTEILAFKTGTAQVSLLNLLKKHTTGTFAIQTFNALLTTDADGVTNFAKALDQHCCSTNPSATDRLTTIKISDVQASLQLATRDDPLSLKIAGRTQQGELDGQFALDVAIKN